MVKLCQSLKILILISVVATGCARSLRTNGPVEKRVPPVCFDVSFKLDKVIHKAKVCFENTPICEHVLNVTKKYGTLGDVTGVTDCGHIDY